MTIDGAHAHDQYDAQIADLAARAPVPGPAGAIGPVGPQGPTGPAGPACVSSMSDPITYIGPGSSNSNDSAALAAGAALVAAVAALPVGTNPGGIIQLGRGFYTLAASGAGSLLDLRARSFVHIRGVGGASGGAAGGAVIETYSASSGGIVMLGDTKSITFQDLMIRYQNPSFTGRLLDTTSATLEADHLRLENVILWGPKTAGQTACLLYLNHAATSVFDRVNFDGGGYQVIGQRNVPITGVSIGNPTIITAPLHGYTTGQYVTIGGTATTPTINSDEGWPITVIDVSRFSIPVNVTAVLVTGGLGGGCRSNNRDFNNAMTFRDCLFIRAGIMAVWNPGKSWVFLNPTVEPLVSGAAGFLGHDPGNHSKGLSILGGWMGDQTTSGTTEQWITYSGTGFSCRGAFISGNQNTFTTAVRFDDNGCSGWEFVGNALSNMYRDVDFGAVPAPGGLYAANGHNNVKAAWAAFKGTVPPGQAFGDPSRPTRPSMFVAW